MSTAALTLHDQYQIELDEATHTYYVTTATYRRRQFDSVTSILAVMGMSLGFESVDREVLARAQFRGTRVHGACQFLDEPDGLDWSCLEAHEVPYVEAWQTFKDDTGFKPFEIERQLANLAYEVAGTTDRIGELRDGSLAVVDLKTGEVDDAAALQTALYGFMYDPETIFHRFAVRLRPDGRPLVEEFKFDLYAYDVQVALSTVCAFKWRKLHNR